MAMTAQVPAEEADGLPTPQRWQAAFAVWLAIAMTVLDSAIANVALPTIAHDFGAAPSEAIWIVNAYQLAIVVSLLPLAALGDRLGYRRVYMAGLAIFTLGSLGCALSHTLPQLTANQLTQEPLLVRGRPPEERVDRCSPTSLDAGA